eukprot:2806544-Prymnesium_polylepis.1
MTGCCRRRAHPALCGRQSAGPAPTGACRRHAAATARRRRLRSGRSTADRCPRQPRRPRGAAPSATPRSCSVLAPARSGTMARG